MYHLIIISNVCSQSYFDYLQSIKNKEKLSPSQKYFSSLIGGLSQKKCKITCVSARPVDPSNCNIKKMSHLVESEEGTEFIYTKIINRRVIKNLNNYYEGKRAVKKIIKNCKVNKEKAILIVDPLSYDISLGAVRAAGNNIVCPLVTDLPSQMTVLNKGHLSKRKNRIKELLIDKIIKRADCFCFLTESMNVINKFNKPYIVIEGLFEKKEYPISEKIENMIMYAGYLSEKFGIKSLIEAFEETDCSLNLCFFGEGPLVNFIEAKSKNDSRIKYCGLLNYNDIFIMETKSKFLINPRPSKEEFTKYSFPSKTIEYMLSGRPLLTTRLSGIPAEYFQYLFVIDDETKDGLKKSIEYVNGLPLVELKRVGETGRQFVMNNKNNVVQAQRFFDFLISLK